MRSFIILSVCIAITTASSGPYTFGYSTADGQSRQESGSGGVVQGAYSYIDANGDARQVRYVADAHGFRAEGDVSVDKRTAVAAAELAAIAPKGTVPVAQLAPVGPVYGGAPFSTYSSYNAPLAAPLPLAAPAAVPLPAWAVAPGAGGRAAYRVEAPGYSVYSQI